MNYLVLGKPISISSIQKPKGGLGSVFEFSGGGLNEIGLNEKFGSSAIMDLVMNCLLAKIK